MIEQNKNKFIKLFKQNIKRDGATELLNWIISSDFFDAPASSRFHSAVSGGLCAHSLLVYERLVKLATMQFGANWADTISAESVAICGLLHDVCKIGYYKVDYRNVKVDGEWVKQPYFMVDDSLPYGHGEKSVYILNGFIKLTREEAMAINWHMGGFDARVKGGDFTISTAFYNYPLAVLLHSADFQTTYLDETR